MVVASAAAEMNEKKIPLIINRNRVTVRQRQRQKKVDERLDWLYTAAVAAVRWREIR